MISSCCIPLNLEIQNKISNFLINQECRDTFTWTSQNGLDQVRFPGIDIQCRMQSPSQWVSGSQRPFNSRLILENGIAYYDTSFPAESTLTAAWYANHTATPKLSQIFANLFHLCKSLVSKYNPTTLLHHYLAINS